MDDVIVRVVDLPSSVEGFLLGDPAGDYNIYINGRLTFKRQQEVLLHETAHIPHLNQEMPVELCEYDAQCKSARATGRSYVDDDDRLEANSLHAIITQGGRYGK